MHVSLRYRVQEWLADRTKRAQYPPERQGAPDATFPLFRWNHAMPWHERLFIGLMSLALLVFSLGLLAVLLAMAWSVL